MQALSRPPAPAGRTPRGVAPQARQRGLTVTCVSFLCVGETFAACMGVAAPAQKTSTPARHRHPCRTNSAHASLLLWSLERLVTVKKKHKKAVHGHSRATGGFACRRLFAPNLATTKKKKKPHTHAHHPTLQCGQARPRPPLRRSPHLQRRRRRRRRWRWRLQRRRRRHQFQVAGQRARGGGVRAGDPQNHSQPGPGDQDRAVGEEAAGQCRPGHVPGRQDWCPRHQWRRQVHPAQNPGGRGRGLRRPPHPGPRRQRRLPGAGAFLIGRRHRGRQLAPRPGRRAGPAGRVRGGVGRAGGGGARRDGRADDADGRAADKDRCVQWVGGGAYARPGDGRPALPARGCGGGHPVRRGAAPGRPGPGPAVRPGHPAAGRADQPPGRRVGGLAGKDAGRL